VMKVEMEEVLRRADVSGTSCQFVARGRTIEDILRQAGQYTTEAHGLAVTPELVEAVKARTTEG
jgi:predicted small metal-binding protein